MEYYGLLLAFLLAGKRGFMQAVVYDRKTVCNISPAIDIVLINITTPNRDYWNTVRLAGWKDLLQLNFHDIVDINDHNFPELVIFNESLAKQTFDFLTKNIGNNFIIHCDAGMSRSVAIGAFLRDFFNYDVKFNGKATDDRYKNVLVYNLLRRQYFGQRNENF